MELNQQSLREPLRILIIGSLDLEAVGDKAAGGTVISLRCLVNELRRRTDVELRVVDIGSSREETSLLKDIGRAMSFLHQATRQVRHVDVVTLHLCSPSSLGLPALVLSRIFRKPLIIRKFGGNDYRASRAYCWPRLADFILRRADLYLAQTRYLVAQAHRRGIMHCQWFPTHRPINSSVNSNHKRTTCRRFVYVGQVREYKGIRELVAATERLDSPTTVDVYGPIFDDLPADLFHRRQKIFYKGVLNHRDVVSTMRQYDAFILPTKALSEGYPGAILEAYAAGLPVITSTCGAIQEIVDQSSGILIEPKSVEALCLAMKKLTEDSELYVRLCKGARDRAAEFSAEHWAEEFVTYSREIIEKGSKVHNARKEHRA